MKMIFAIISISIFISCNSDANNFNGNKKNILPPDSIIDNTPKPFYFIEDLPKNFDTIPGGNFVFRSSQPSLDQLKKILEAYDIKTVIRMNAKESTNVSPEDEKNVVESMGRKYVWVNAHLGYEKNKGYLGSLRIIQPILNGGNVLIHCTHGADRTGYQVAKYLENNFNWTDKQLWDYTVRYNSWENKIKNKEEGYIKYMEAFMTYDEWKVK